MSVSVKFEYTVSEFNSSFSRHYYSWLYDEYIIVEFIFCEIFSIFAEDGDAVLTDHHMFRERRRICNTRQRISSGTSALATSFFNEIHLPLDLQREIIEEVITKVESSPSFHSSLSSSASFVSVEAISVTIHRVHDGRLDFSLHDLHVEGPKETEVDTTLATKLEIDALSRAEFEGVYDCLICSICLDDFRCRGRVVTMPCNHFYHENCIMAWLKEHQTCPNCRSDLVTIYKFSHR